MLLVACSVYRTVVTTGFARPNLLRFSRGAQCGWGPKEFTSSVLQQCSYFQTEGSPGEFGFNVSNSNRK